MQSCLQDGPTSGKTFVKFEDEKAGNIYNADLGGELCTLASTLILTLLFDHSGLQKYFVLNDNNV